MSSRKSSLPNKGPPIAEQHTTNAFAEAHTAQHPHITHHDNVSSDNLVLPSNIGPHNPTPVLTTMPHQNIIHHSNMSSDSSVLSPTTAQPSQQQTPGNASAATRLYKVFDALQPSISNLAFECMAAINYRDKRANDRRMSVEPLTPAETQALAAVKNTWCKHFYASMVDATSVHDKPSAEGYKRLVASQGYATEDLLVGACRLWDVFFDGATRGWIKPPFATRTFLAKTTAKGAIEINSLYERLTMISNALQTEKNICTEVIEDEMTAILSLVYHPAEWQKMKSGFRNLNGSRQRNTNRRNGLQNPSPKQLGTGQTGPDITGSSAQANTPQGLIFHAGTFAETPQSENIAGIAESQTVVGPGSSTSTPQTGAHNPRKRSISPDDAEASEVQPARPSKIPRSEHHRPDDSPATDSIDSGPHIDLHPNSPGDTAFGNDQISTEHEEGQLAQANSADNVFISDNEDMFSFDQANMFYFGHSNMFSINNGIIFPLQQLDTIEGGHVSLAESALFHQPAYSMAPAPETGEINSAQASAAQIHEFRRQASQCQLSITIRLEI